MNSTVSSNVSPVYIGTYNGTNEPFHGGLYRVIARDGIGGPSLIDVDFTTGLVAGNQTSFVASTGQTVSLNRSASKVRKLVTIRSGSC